jgi:hypothetical protein
MLSKLAKPDSRGVIYGSYGVMGSTGVLIIMKLGGDLFDSADGTIFEHRWPFIIAFFSMFVMFSLTLILGLSGKVKV